MSAGLYSGVSGLALGIGLYRNVSGLWGGASGLINGFGGADPYAGASLYLNFLAGAPLDSRIDFSRGTNATLIDSTGRLTYAPNNLLTFSTDATNAAWTKASTTVVGGVSDPLGGTNAQTVTATAAAAQLYNFLSIGSAIGTRYLFSVWVRRRSGSGVISLFNPNATATAIAVTSTWTQFFVSGNGGSGFVYPGFLISSSGDQIDIYFPVCAAITYETAPRPADQVATAASAYYGPRFDYDPVTLTPRGLLIEEARTNLVQQSEAFGTSPWSAYGVSTVTANATASPAGTITADLLTANGSNGQQQTIPSVLANTAYAFSIYVKLGSVGTQIAVELSCYAGGTGGTFLGYVFSSAGRNITSGTPVGNGWFRLTISGTTIATTDTLVLRLLTVNTGDNFYIWGTQLELGAFATSYIPTVASTGTRNADNSTMTGTNFSSWFNAAAGTFVSDFDVNGVDASSRRKVWNGVDSGLQRLALRSTDTAPTFPLGAVGTGTSVVSLSGAPMVANIPAKVALAYGANSALSQNGAITATDANVASVAPTSFGIGWDQVAIGQYLNGHVRAIAFFNTRLPNAQLQTLTAPSLATTLSLDFTSGSYNVGF